jgi:hypothetical protein
VLATAAKALALASTGAAGTPLLRLRSLARRVGSGRVTCRAVFYETSLAWLPPPAYQLSSLCTVPFSGSCLTTLPPRPVQCSGSREIRCSRRLFHVSPRAHGLAVRGVVRGELLAEAIDPWIQ